MDYLATYEANTQPNRGDARASKIARRKMLADAYAAGEAAAIVARRFKTTPPTVLKAARRHGVTIRSQSGGFRYKDEMRQAEIVAYHDGGKRTLQECGDHFGVTRERVRQLLVRAGVDVRVFDRKAIERDRIVRAAEAAFADGESILVVAGRFEISTTTLAAWCRAAGVWVPGCGDRHRDKRERYRRMADLYAAGGVTIGEVAAQFGVSSNTVARALSRCGVSDWRRQKQAA